MSQRRNGLRVAGWLGILIGLICVAIAVLAGSEVAQLAGGYGLLFVAAGSWIVGGLHVLAWREQSVPRHAGAPVSKRTESLSR